MAQVKRRERKSGHAFEISATIGKDTAGKPIYKTKTITAAELKAKTPKKQLEEAKLLADAWERALLEGGNYDIEKMTYSDLVEVWRKEWLPRNLTKNQQEEYFFNVNKYGLPAIGHLPLVKLNRRVLKPLVNSLTDKNGLMPETVHKIVTSLRSPLNYAIEEEMIDNNPFNNIKLPTIQKKKELDCFDERQTTLFLEALDQVYEKPRKARTRKDSSGVEYSVKPYVEKITIPTMWKAYYYTEAFTGCRTGEMVALQWRDIDFLENTITIRRALAWSKKEGPYLKEPKANSFRKLSVPIIVMDRLRAWKEEQEETCRSLGSAWQGQPIGDGEQYVFITYEGRHMYRTSASDRYHSILDLWNEAVEKKASKAKDDETKEKLRRDILPHYRLYDMRHSNASIMLAHGVPITTVSARLGHSRTSITLDVYSHALPSADDKAVKALESSIFSPQAPQISMAGQNPTETLNALNLSQDELTMLLQYRASKQTSTDTAASVSDEKKGEKGE